MYVSLSIMKPNPGYEQHTIDSMRRYGQAAHTQAGLQLVTTLREPQTGDLFGLAIWESEEAARSASEALAAAVANDDFGTWVADMQSFRLSEAD